MELKEWVVLAIISSPILIVFLYFVTCLIAAGELNFASRCNESLRVPDSAEAGQFTDEQIERYRIPFKWVIDDWYNGRSLPEIIIDLVLLYIPVFLFWMFMVFKKDYKDKDRTRRLRKERAAKRRGEDRGCRKEENGYEGFFRKDS